MKRVALPAGSRFDRLRFPPCGEHQRQGRFPTKALRAELAVLGGLVIVAEKLRD
jgi:hypothetical protein